MNDMQSLVPMQAAGELDISSRVAGEVARVQAAFILAKKFPRDMFVSRKKMMESCERKRFSEKARYRRPVGKDRFGNQTYAEGFSVHFARPAAVMYGNIDIDSGTIFEDEQIRKVFARATDTESNVTYRKEGIVEKVIERKNATGRQVISERTNSRGDKTYLVAAYPHEVDLMASKTIAILLRDCVLPLIPPDILDEVEDKIVEVQAAELTQDPITARKKLVDAFREVGVSSAQLAEYLGHPVDELTAKEYTDLVAIGRTLRDGQAVWADYIQKDKGDSPGPVTLKPTKGREQWGFTPPASEPGPADDVPPPTEEQPETQQRPPVPSDDTAPLFTQKEPSEAPGAPTANELWLSFMKRNKLSAKAQKYVVNGMVPTRWKTKDVSTIEDAGGFADWLDSEVIDTLRENQLVGGEE